MTTSHKMSSDRAKRIALLRKENEELDERLEEEGLIRARDEKRSRLQELVRQGEIAQRSHTERMRAIENAPILIPHSVLHPNIPLPSVNQRLKLTQTSKEETKNAEGVVKFKTLKYKATPFTLMKAGNSISEIAYNILAIPRENQDMKNLQIRLIFESDVNTSTHTDLILIQKNGGLNIFHIMRELEKILANKIASTSPGQWVLKTVEVKGTV